MSRQATLEHAALRPAATKSTTTDPYKWPCFALVLGALSFNFFLCFINTKLTAISAPHVIAAEILIISMAFLISVRRIGPKQFTLIAAAFIYLLFLILARANESVHTDIDPKIIRDFIIPLAFFLLGMCVRDLRNADTIVLVSAILVTAVALFEYFFLDVYLQYFNIIKYYVARGSVEPARLEILSTNLFVSGIRPEGRELLPMLGDRRVSSILLEPVSPGNFAVMLFFWAMVRLKFEKVLCAALLLMAIFLIIMADNRFGAYLCALALGVFLLPSRYVSAVVAFLPVVCVSGLLGAAYGFEHSTTDNSFLGRLVDSGRVLVGFDIPTWLGVGESASSAFDSGYGYVISQVGIFGLIVFWFVFITLKGATPEFHIFRSLTGLYLATILCVSYSPFTIKTAALLWFLLGALSVVPEQHIQAIRTPRSSDPSPVNGMRDAAQRMRTFNPK